MYLESESLASIATSVRHMVSLWVFAFQLERTEINVASGHQPMKQETSFLLDTEDFSSGMCRFGFGSSTPKGGVNIWDWTVVLLHAVRWD